MDLPDPDVTFYDRYGRPCERRIYHESITYTTAPPFGGNLAIAFGALCPDGVRRTARPSGDGTPDTFFSIPTWVYARVNGRTVRVYGFITHETVQGFTTETENDPTTIKFWPYKYRKHHMAVMSPETGPETDT